MLRVTFLCFYLTAILYRITKKDIHLDVFTFSLREENLRGFRG